MTRLAIAAFAALFVLGVAWEAAIVVAWPHTETYGPDTYLVLANHPVVADCSGSVEVDTAC